MPRSELDHMFVEWPCEGNEANVAFGGIISAMTIVWNMGRVPFVMRVPLPRKGYIAVIVGCIALHEEIVQDLYQEWLNKGSPAFDFLPSRASRPVLGLIIGAKR